MKSFRLNHLYWSNQRVLVVTAPDHRQNQTARILNVTNNLSPLSPQKNWKNWDRWISRHQRNKYSINQKWLRKSM